MIPLAKKISFGFVHVKEFRYAEIKRATGKYVHYYDDDNYLIYPGRCFLQNKLQDKRS